MKNFVFQNPTKLLFGRGAIERMRAEIPADKKLMVTFGGGSVRANGVYERVTPALEGLDFVERWCIEPNPKVETVREAVAMCRREGVEFLLAVGGGSVLDATKLIAAAVHAGADAWELVRNPALLPEAVLPFADVMTLPATGSEMNNGAVISNAATREKFAFYSRFPLFSVLDPEVTYSLPEYQIACGLADTFVHTVEQYLTVAGESPLMDRWAEGLLSTLVEVAPGAMAAEPDYDSRATYMLCATMALNGFIAMGVSQDWATHRIGHEITALHGVTHAQTLAVVLPAVMAELQEQKHDKLLQYAARVWGLCGGSPQERIDGAIARTGEFFRSLGLKTRLSELGIGRPTAEEIVRRFAERGTRLGEKANVDAAAVGRILERCL